VNGRPVKRKPEEIRTGPVRELPLSAEDWHEVRHGISLFNAGKFWHAHEAWELVWQRQAEDERLFFQGLIQLAAAYHHLVRKHHRPGYVNNLKKAEAILRVFTPEYLGISIGPLLEAIDAGLDAAEGKGELPAGEDEFRLIPRIPFRVPCDPDLVVAVRTATAGGDFHEGVALFNRGYHWEAHERWEEAMRNAEGDAKGFLQGFVQAAAGLSFLTAGKSENAAYLILKSIENLRRFGGVDAGVDYRELLEWMSGALHPDGSGPPQVRAGERPVPKIMLNGHGEGGSTSPA
jgi:predicted metal-dependent hydrolase